MEFRNPKDLAVVPLLCSGATKGLRVSKFCQLHYFSSNHLLVFDVTGMLFACFISTQRQGSIEQKQEIY